MDTNKIFIDMAQRAHEFAEMCRLMQKIPDMPLTAEVKDALDEYAKRLGLPKEDPEAWREEYRKKQAAGVKFQRKSYGEWVHPINMFDFSGKKEDYREVQEAPAELPPKFHHLAARALYWKQRAEGTNESWQAGIDGCWLAIPLDVEPPWSNEAEYRPNPEDRLDRNLKFSGVYPPNPPTPHAAERALWKAQREAGTNEVWQVLSGNGVADIRVDVEPNWHPDFIYRTKPMKLTAKIISGGVCKIPYYWEFFGTREEYRAECEKNGYIVVSEIKEVVEKPKTVTYYMAMAQHNTDTGIITSFSSHDKNNLQHKIKSCGYAIIGDIEEREVEA